MTSRFVLPIVYAMIACLAGAGCDSITPETDSFLVVQGFVEAAKPPPPILLKETMSLDQNLASEPEQFVNDASIVLTLNNTRIPYQRVRDTPGQYEPAPGSITMVPPSSDFDVEINWEGKTARTRDRVPTAIALDSIRVRIPDEPVSAILIDTLRLDTPEVGARRGFIYLVEVDLWWTPDDSQAPDTSFWIETRLRPKIDFSSKVLDVFLLAEEVQPEENIDLDPFSRRSWTGVYAVPTDDSLGTVPDHALTVQLLRGTNAYALFAASRNNPERREPISNIDGAIGVIAGISLATAEIHIEGGQAQEVTP